MSARQPSSLLAYVAPSVTFGVFTTLEGYVPAGLYPAMYIAKVCAVTCTLVAFRSTLRDIQVSARAILPAVLVGLFVLAEWILIDQHVPYPHLGTRVGFNPFSEIADPTLRTAFLAARLYGLILMVPVMEELFLRSFFLRYLIRPDFANVAIGDITVTAVGGVALISAIAHPEWVVAIIASLAYTLLLNRTRSLFSSVLAHAITNAGLGWYVLATGQWQFW